MSPHSLHATTVRTSRHNNIIILEYSLTDTTILTYGRTDLPKLRKSSLLKIRSIKKAAQRIEPRMINKCIMMIHKITLYVD